MSTILPQGAIAKVQFFEARDETWTARAVEIGSTPAAVALVATRAAAARAAYTAQALAQQQARAATQAFHAAVTALTDAGAIVIKQVKTKAASDGSDDVYPLAMLPVPARPSRLPPPGKPTNFAVALHANGSLRLKWQCKNPKGSSGTLYQIARRVGIGGGAGGGFEHVGVSGVKSFVDATLPPGVASVTYQVTAVRSTSSGIAAQFTVNFGVAAGAPAAGIQVGQGPGGAGGAGGAAMRAA